MNTFSNAASAPCSPAGQPTPISHQEAISDAADRIRSALGHLNSQLNSLEHVDRRIKGQSVPPSDLRPTTAAGPTVAPGYPALLDFLITTPATLDDIAESVRGMTNRVEEVTNSLARSLRL